jgi:hypothetical protein
MAEDRTSTEYHLTPHGWVTGTYRYFDAVQGEEIQPPPDRVETIEVTSEQASGWSKTCSYSTSIWKSSHISETELDALYKKFPKKFPSSS